MQASMRCQRDARQSASQTGNLPFRHRCTQVCKERAAGSGLLWQEGSAVFPGDGSFASFNKPNRGSPVRICPRSPRMRCELVLRVQHVTLMFVVQIP
jgi:hypothetical protein